MENCIFCKIANDEVKSYKVFEDENFLAFLDLTQMTYGHTLVIPKKHSENVFLETNEIKEEILFFIDKVKQKLEEKLDAKGFNILININKDAGQEVFHTHIHIIPRYNDDGFKITHKKNKVELEEVYKKIQE